MVGFGHQALAGQERGQPQGEPRRQGLVWQIPGDLQAAAGGGSGGFRLVGFRQGYAQAAVEARRGRLAEAGLGQCQAFLEDLPRGPVFAQPKQQLALVGQLVQALAGRLAGGWGRLDFGGCRLDCGPRLLKQCG